MCTCTKTKKEESIKQKVVNTVVGLICVIALVLVCSEPAEGTGFGTWAWWELAWLAVFAGCAAYLNKHLPDDK